MGTAASTRCLTPSSHSLGVPDAADPRSPGPGGLRALARENRALNYEILLIEYVCALHRASYDPNQPRVPAGSSDGGRWAGAQGGGGGSKPVRLAENRPNTANPNRVATDGPSGNSTGQPQSQAGSTFKYNPTGYGAHDYTSHKNEVCPADLHCNDREMADYMSRFAVPGQNPAIPTPDNSTNPVFDPRTGLFAGWVDTAVTDNGLTVVNTTRMAHVLYDGQITRRAFHNSDGSWSVVTHGIGNNWIPGMNCENQIQGPKIFDAIDAAMRAYILRDHARSKCVQFYNNRSRPVSNRRRLAVSKDPNNLVGG